jgi:hypothetical protein
VQVLSFTLDLVGSIELDAHLAGEASALGSAEVDRSAQGALVALALERFDGLEDLLRGRLRDLPDGRSGLWSGERLFELLRREGVLERRRARAVAVAAKQASEAYGLAVLNLLDRIRAEARSLRHEIGPRIAALGDAAARLEEFDARLWRARQRFTSGLYARITPEILRQYALRLEQAVCRLPRKPGREDVAAWTAPDEWLVRLHSDVSRVVLAVLARERETLLGLLDSVVAEAGATAVVAATEEGEHG